MTEEELYNILDADTSDPDDTLQYIKDDNFVFKNEKMLLIDSEPVTNSAGSVGYFETKKHPIFNDSEVKEIVCVSRKIENDKLIKLSEGERASRKDFLYFQKKFLSKIKSPILFLDAQGRIISVSKTFSDLFGTEVNSICGLFVENLVSIKTFPKQGLSLELENVEIKINDVSIEGFVSISPWYFSSDEAGGHLLFFSDRSKEIALKRELEQEKKQSILSDRHKSLGEMSAGVGHEINNPLAIILGTLEKINILYPDEASENIKADLEVIKKSSLRISAIVKGLKNLSRDASQDDFESISIIDIINDALSLCEGRAINLGIEISKEVNDTFNINCRPTEIAQVIYNLISNSIDEISDQNKPWIKIITSNEDKKNILSIVDSGAGVSETIANNIFDPFFTTKRAGHGTGLGLGISKQIMLQHSGDLILNTKSDNTHFIVQFKDA
jgi:signal transduction histidine kinase